LPTIASLVPRARTARAFAVALLLGLTFAAVGAHSAQAANPLTVSPGVDSVRDQSTSVAISGATDASRSLYAYVFSIRNVRVKDDGWTPGSRSRSAPCHRPAAAPTSTERSARA
jgi:hypothetical protein